MPDPITADAPGPVDSLVMRQAWNHLSSFHWPYDPAEVQRLLPEGLTVDTFDDVAWVGLIPFHLERISFLRRLPAVPYFGSFPEVNVRTYVVDPRGRRSVWFFSLDINRAPPVAIARVAYGLPYCWGEASIARADLDDPASSARYWFARRWPRGGGHVEAVVRPGTAIAPGDVSDFEHFVTARWGMSTVARSKLFYGSVWHPQWPLHRAELVSLDQNLMQSAGLSEPQGDPYALFSPGVQVHIGPLTKV